MLDEMKPSRETVAENVQRNRVSKGWTQTRLAQEAGVAQARIAELEAGRYEPRTDTIDRIAIALEIAPATLLIPVESEVAV